MSAYRPIASALPPAPDEAGSGTDLSEANITNSNLARADLTSANLTGAVLWKTNFTDSNLTDADLTGAKLRGANVTGADLTGANLTRAINLTQEQLDSACIRKGGKPPALPEGLKPPQKECPSWKR